MLEADAAAFEANLINKQRKMQKQQHLSNDVEQNVKHKRKRRSTKEEAAAQKVIDDALAEVENEKLMP